jgi:hypothetical protein
MFDEAAPDMLLRKSIRESWQRRLRDESGTVESALVLVPLLVLVLSILQIAAGVLGRQVASNRVQSTVVQSGLRTATIGNPFEFMKANGIDAATGLSLTGGGQLLIGEEQSHLAAITPLLPRGDNFASVGVTLGEGP